MAKYLLFAFSVLLFCSSCSEEYYLERKEDRLVGAWEFEKVYYKSDNALFRDNITGEYAGDLIEFFADYTCVYDDYSAGITYPGDWHLYLDRDHSSDGADTEYFVDAMFYGMFQEDDFYIFGEIDRLNHNKLHLEARDRNGTYTFKLRRL